MRVRYGSCGVTACLPIRRYASCTLTRGSHGRAVCDAPRGVEHLARRRARRHGGPELARQVLGEHEVLLLQLDVGEHVGVVDEQRRAVADDRRGDDALEHRVDDGGAIDAGLLDERDALGERGHRHDEREVDRDLREDRLAVRPDVGDLRADRVQDVRDVVERRAVAADHDRHLARPRASPASPTPGSPGTTRRSRATRSDSATDASGAIVEMSAQTVPGRSPASTPSSPSAVASIAAVLVSIVKSTSTDAASSRGVSAQPMPGVEQRLGLGLRPVPADDLVAGVEQALRDPGAHGAETGEAHALDVLEHAAAR